MCSPPLGTISNKDQVLRLLVCRQLNRNIDKKAHQKILVGFSFHFCQISLQRNVTIVTIESEKENAQLIKNQLGVPCCKSLTMSYFHTGIRTIIGAKSFHCPVRDGKEWYQLAMVIRHNWLTDCPKNNPSNS